jgi:hypothetical protein
VDRLALRLVAPGEHGAAPPPGPPDAAVPLGAPPEARR